MAAKRNRYREMERTMTALLIVDTLIFLAFLLFSGMGILWLKILGAIVAIIISVGCLVLLFLSKELLRPRSLWMTTGFLAVLLCTTVSLIVNFPAPMP